MKGLMMILVGLMIVLSGCVEDMPVTTTTTEVISTTPPTSSTSTQTTSTPTSTTMEVNETTTTVSRRCRFLNFQIKSHAYREGNLTLYFENIGSEEIDDFEVNLNFGNRTEARTYLDQDISYHTTKIYKIEVGPGLDNATIVDKDCGKSYFVNV